MNLARTAAVLAALVSLAGNAFLANARARSMTRQTAAPTPPAARKEQPAAPVPQPEAGLINFEGAKCGQRLTTLEDDLSQRSKALRGVLPPRLLFGRGQANPEAERLLAPIVTRVVAAVEFPDGKHTLECRDVACKLVFTELASAGEEAWDQALSSSAEFQAWSRQFALDQATPTVDPVSRRSLVVRTVYFKLDGPRAVAAGQGER